MANHLLEKPTTISTVFIFLIDNFVKWLGQVNYVLFITLPLRQKLPTK
jgi:hypothetical protein